MSIENGKDAHHTPESAGKTTKSVEQQSNKKWLTFSNFTTVLLVCFALAMVFIPDFKGWTMQGLMKIGLFQPDIPDDVSQIKNNSPSTTDKISTSSTQAQIPDVTFLDSANNPIKLSELKGKVVFLNFWATWCPPCIAEMPAIQKLYNQFKDNKDVQFLLVDADGNYKKSSAFMARKKFTMPVFTPGSSIPDVYFSGSLPTTVIFDKTRRIVFSHAGAADYGNPKVTEFINKLIKMK